MARTWIWMQLLIGWLPVGAVFALLILTAHPDVAPATAVFLAARMMLAGALLGVVVHRGLQRWPWPHPMRLSFLAGHAVAAFAYAVAFVLGNSVIESLVRWQLVLALGNGLGPFLIMGVWLYVMIAGVAYANFSAARVAQAEALAARSRLAALRAQLNPHFLFNALHTVVQLIPRHPARATEAAEELAALLRTTIEGDRDVVSLADELAFVRRYLAIERLRFGDRLVLVEDIAPDALVVTVPSFALQTLVENAIRHGAAPRATPTRVTLFAQRRGAELTVGVRDGADDQSADDRDAPPEAHVAEWAGATSGTGLRRLRDRLAALYGSAARLTVSPPGAQPFTATITVPADVDD